MNKRCPRCGSESRSVARPLPTMLRGQYTCRDAWHMPSLSSDAEEALLALETVAAVAEAFPPAPYIYDRRLGSYVENKP